MRIQKQDIPVKIDITGARARQLVDFGDASGFGKMAGEYFSLGEGADIAPLLHGLENNLCQSPHWGYLLEGKLSVTFTDGSIEVVNGGDMFYWPPGHSVRADAASEVILFSPQQEHVAVLDHMLARLGG